MHSYDEIEMCLVQRKESTDIEHFGIPGMSWGKRRYQNPDGSLTPEGYMRYYGVSRKQADEAVDLGYEPSAHRLTEKGLTEMVGLNSKTAKKIYDEIRNDPTSETAQKVEGVMQDILNNKGSLTPKEIKKATKDLGKAFTNNKKKSDKAISKTASRVTKAVNTVSKAENKRLEEQLKDPDAASKGYATLLTKNKYYKTQFDNATDVINRMSKSSVDLVDQIAEGKDFRQIRIGMKYKSDEKLAKEIARMNLENNWARQYATKMQYNGGRHAVKTAIKGTATAATVALGFVALKGILSNALE